MGKSKSTTTQSIPEWQKDFLTGTAFPLAQQIADRPFEAYGGQFAPAGLSDLGQQAASGYGSMAGMDPMAYQQQQQALTSANMNPYQQQVIDTSLAQINRSADQARTGLEASLIGSGAFGSRGEVARGEFEAGVQGQRDAMIANMLQQGYGQAQGLAGQQLAQSNALQSQGLSGLAGLGNLQTQLESQQLAGQYGDFIRGQEYPMQQLGAIMGAAGGNYGGTTTESYKPGLFDYLSAGATAASAFSDIRLKENVQFEAEIDGVKFYTWDWNDEGKRVADPAQPKLGVIADELMQTRPEFVHRGADGYLRVNYTGLMADLSGQ